jgi:WD40 repeat protein
MLHTGARDARAIAWSRDGLWLACGCRNKGIVLHEMTHMHVDSSSQSGQAAGSGGSKSSYLLKAHLHKITSVDFSHDSQLLASCSWDKSIVVWGVLLRQQFARIELSAWPTALVWAPARLILACATMDRRVVVHLASLHFHPEFLHVSGATLVPIADLRAHEEGVWSLTWCLPPAFSTNHSATT